MADGTLLSLLTIALPAFLAGGALAWLISQRKVQDLRETNASLQTHLELSRKSAEDRDALLERVQEQFSHTFTALSADALRRNNTEFLRLAGENLKQHHIKAQTDLAAKEKSIEHLVKPIREALDKTDKQIQQIEKDRKEAYGSLKTHLESMARTQELLQSETRNLVKALRRPEVRGQWGELSLKRLVELAGMVEHCDFYEQESIDTDEGVKRPDMVVRLPEGREIVVDVKTPLDAYLSAMEAGSDEERRQHLEHHARNVRERVRELAGKAYWSQFERTPDFVVLFIPGEQFLSAAFDIDAKLLEDALEKRVIVATPTSFIALLRAVAFGWRQQSVAENAEQIRKLGADLYRRLTTFTEHLSKVGRSLGSSLAHYNKAVGSLERQVLPGARKFTELGISSSKEVPELEPVETSPREMEVRPAEETPPPPSDTPAPADSPPEKH